MKFLLKSKSGLSVVIHFNERGFLVAAQVDQGGASDDALPKVWPWIPSTMDKLETLRTSTKHGNDYTISECAPDTSFTSFWEDYNYKVGSKAKAEKLWNAMTESERVAALSAIGKYGRWLTLKNNMEKAYPETWLRQRRWENNYKI
jgi:hypothetical protein